mmetsp:Transcript_11110/g.13883  ORF Transcript_11110/g.13883 Transcript_11110/m.13883 type:complete len:220 (+) Transcript_11110:200-859(+)
MAVFIPTIEVRGGKRSLLSLSIYLYICMVLVCIPVLGINFDLESTKTRCVMDILDKDVLATGEFTVSTGSTDSTHVNIRVIGPNSEEVFRQDNIRSGKFGFTATLPGKYSACFTNEGMIRHSINFDYRSGVEAKDLTGIIQTEHLKPIEAEVLRISEALQAIRHEVLSTKVHEEEMRETNDSTNARVTYFSYFSVFISLTLGVWQIVHLKNYFLEKKLI